MTTDAKIDTNSPEFLQMCARDRIWGEVGEAEKALETAVEHLATAVGLAAATPEAFDQEVLLSKLVTVQQIGREISDLESDA